MDKSELQGNIAQPAPSASVVERIRFLIRLIRKNQTQFAELVGLNPSNISKILSGKIAVSESLINRIVVNLGVSKQWLVDGTDVPFPRADGPHEFNLPAQPVRRVNNPGAPVYDIDVTAGSPNLSRMFTDEHIIGRLTMPGLNPELPIVKVSGNSMAPRIHNGAYISIRKVEPEAPILWGQIYVVLLEDYRMVKYIRHHEDPSKVVLHSENPNYDDIVIKRSDIVDLFIVESILNYEIVG